MLKPSDLLSKRLLKLDYNPKTATYNFNIIDELHADENAHTRILAALLRCDPVRISFWHRLQKINSKFPVAYFESNCCADDISVFSDYIDLAIDASDYALIIENKIHNAPDQDRQIERYVTTQKQKHKKIIVLYLTLDGKKEPSPESHTKKCEADKNCLLIKINYKNHILPWLKNDLHFSITEQYKQPYLQAGILQYARHLERITSGVNEDPFSELKERIREEIGSSVTAVNLLGEIDYFVGYWRRYLLQHPEKIDDLNGKLEKEKQSLLSEIIGYGFGRTHRDINGWMYLGRIRGCVEVCVHHWSNISPVQLELYCDGGADSQYLNTLKEIKAELAKVEDFKDPLVVEENNWLRYPIYNSEQAKNIVALLLGNPIEFGFGTNDVEFPDEIKIQNLLILKKCIEDLFDRDQRTESWKDTSLVKCLNQSLRMGYSYDPNGLALHLCRHEQYLYLAAEMWFKDKDPFEIQKMLYKQNDIYPFVHYHWRGKTLLEFPVINEEYGRKICEILKEIKDNI